MADRCFPNPVPLPSLPEAFSRRAALFGAVSATGVLGGAAVARVVAPVPAGAGRLAALYARYLAVPAAARTLPADEDDVADAAVDAALGLQEDALQVRPVTLADALAGLDWARREFAGAYVEDGNKVDRLDRWTLAMMDGALELLRARAGAAA